MPFDAVTNMSANISQNYNVSDIAWLAIQCSISLLYSLENECDSDSDNKDGYQDSRSAIEPVSILIDGTMFVLSLVTLQNFVRQFSR